MADSPRRAGTPTRAATLVEADAVVRRFGTFVAVDDASLRVEPGEVVGLIGANGAGKTTLLKVLLGLLPASSGRPLLFGAAPDRRSRRRLGYVPQGLGLYDDLTVAQNLAFAAGTYGVRTPSLPPGLAELADELVGRIGLGRQRRLAFAAALCHGPELLVLDEPTSGVDPLARARLWDTVHEQAEAGVGVLVTTHYLQEAQQCDRLVLMAAGRVVATGSEADLVAGRTAVQVRTAHWQDAFSALAGAGLPVVLDGRAVRLAETPAADVRAHLTAAGVDAQVTEVPATLEEAVVAAARP